MSEVLFETRDSVAIITFNRPERRNAMSLGLMRAFSEALDQSTADDAIRAVILTGAGDKAFGAGLDIKEAPTLTPDEQAEQHALYTSFQQRLAAFPKPLLAAIEGVAAGGSLQMALHADLIIAAEGARIGMPELTAGRPCILGSFLLHRLIGPSHTARLVLGQDWLTAGEALACGLVAATPPQGKALETALAYAERLAQTAPNALAATRAWLRRLRDDPNIGLAGAIAHADAILPESGDSEEARAASARFSGGSNA